MIEVGSRVSALIIISVSRQMKNSFMKYRFWHLGDAALKRNIFLAIKGQFIASAKWMALGNKNPSARIGRRWVSGPVFSPELEVGSVSLP